MSCLPISSARKKMMLGRSVDCAIAVAAVNKGRELLKNFLNINEYYL